MLTEDMLAAVMDAVSGYERLILVGDPAQLPPIGVGRPFIDLVKLLQEQGKGHALLTVRFRQEVISKGKEAETPPDLLLADWFEAFRGIDRDSAYIGECSEQDGVPMLSLRQVQLSEAVDGANFSLAVTVQSS